MTKMEPPDGNIKEAIKGEYEPKNGNSRTNAKDIRCNNDQPIRKSASRLPRIVQLPPPSPIKTNSSPKIGWKLADTGDTNCGPSKLPNGVKPKKGEILSKLRPTRIPRRKTLRKEPRGASNTSRSPTRINAQYSSDDRNIQRINLMISPDFSVGEQEPPAMSVAFSRPIPTLPTLGQIYGNLDITNTDRFSDWILELHSTAASNSVDHQTSIHCERADACLCHDRLSRPRTDQQNSRVASVVPLCSEEKQSTNSTATNRNATLSLKSDLAFSTKERESGNRTVSSVTKKVKRHSSTQLNGSKVSSKGTYSTALTKPDTGGSQDTNYLLREKPTMVLRKSPEIEVIEKYQGIGETDYSSLMMSEYMRIFGHSSVPSYTECQSEILQKTTNFEGFRPKSLSSTSCTDRLSNEKTVLEEFGALNNHPHIDWRRHDDDRSFETLSTTTASTDTKDSSWQSTSEFSKSTSSDYQNYYSRYYDKRGGNSHQCMKCHGRKKFPSDRYKLPVMLRSWRPICIRRICRRRWNHMWQKTAQRWANWSAKTPAVHGKIRVMHYLQRTIIWEDANIQTNLHLGQDTDPDSKLREMKSTAVSALGSWQSTGKERASSSCKTKIGRTSRCPSMFPFLCKTKRKSVRIKLPCRKKEAGKIQASIKLIKKQSDDFMWDTANREDAANEIRIAKSCHDAAPSICMTRVSSLVSLVDFNTCDVKLNECEGTENLSFMTDTMTNTQTGVSKLLESLMIESREVNTEPVCWRNAETEVISPPTPCIMVDTLSRREFNNITFYKPELAHLGLTSTKYPPLKTICMKLQMRNTGTATTQPAEDAVIQTVIEDSTLKTFLDVTTSYPTVSETKPDVITGSANTSQIFEPNREEIGCQTVEQAVVSKFDMQTQVSHDSIVSTTSTTGNPSTFISEYMVTNATVEAFSIQTPPQLPTLVVSGPKVMSISSEVMIEKRMANSDKAPVQLKRLFPPKDMTPVQIKLPVPPMGSISSYHKLKLAISTARSSKLSHRLRQLTDDGRGHITCVIKK